MGSTVRLLMVGEATVFFLAALVHAGMLINGYQHREARIAETVIGSVLLFGVVLSWNRPMLTRIAGFAAQAFALVGTLIGIFTIIVGVGPRTVPDIVYHVAIVATLIWGLIMIGREPADKRRWQK